MCVAGVSLEDCQYATCSRKVKIVPDTRPSEFSKFVSTSKFCDLISLVKVLGTTRREALNALNELLKDISSYDAIIIPGGLEGAKTIASNPDILNLLVHAHKSGKIVAAICAGRSVRLNLRSYQITYINDEMIHSE